MKIKNFFKKTIYSLLLLGLIFSNSIGTAQALFGSGPSIPSFEEIADKMEKRYGFDSNVMRSLQQKTDPPQVEVFFSNTSPKTGEEVTATALPKFFRNSNESLYYTWFLFREGDDLNNEDAIEEAKQRAMGMVARGDFDPILFGTDYTVSGDDDGYDASYGGDDGRGGKETSFSDGDNGFESSHYLSPQSKSIVDTDEISRCYRHNFGFSNPADYPTMSGHAGKDLIVDCEHKFPQAPKGKKFTNPLDPEGDKLECKDDYVVGDGDFGKNEELCWQLDPTNPDTDGDGFVDEADLAGLGQTQLTWTFQEGDRVGVIVEGTSTIAIREAKNPVGTEITNQNVALEGGDLSGDQTTDDFSGEMELGFNTTTTVVDTDINSDVNPYYKIMWAGLDTCDKEQVEGKDKRLLIKNDECEGTDDYGYTFLATKRVSEASQDLLKATLNFTPEKPQANKNNPEYSNYINVIANFVESDIEDDFVYYEWDVYKCTESQIMDDTCSSDGYNLTSGCGSTLGSCSDLESNSLIEGMGVNEIKFKGSETFYNDEVFSTSDKIYFKVYLTTKKSQESEQKYISSVDIPINKNDLELDFYRINFDGDEYSSVLSSNPICASGNYQNTCPVYKGQILAVVYNGADTDIKSAYWELDDVKVSALSSDPFPSLFGSLGSYYTYFPITSSGMNLSKVSFKALTDNDETITSERLISAEKPMIKKISTNNEQVWNQTFEDTDGEEVNSEAVLWGKIDEEISLKAETVPSYLENNLDENNLEIKWYLNGQEVDDSFIEDNSDYAISFEDQNQIINFTLTGEEGESLNVKAKIVKSFTVDENTFLDENWETGDFSELSMDKAITIKKTDSDPPTASGVTQKNNSVNLFMASTYKNAPEYFIFIIKTAIISVLFWSLLYGFSYWSSREYKLEKE